MCNSIVSLCPVCNGRGNVEYGFYRDKEDKKEKAKKQLFEICRACQGKGVIIEFGKCITYYAYYPEPYRALPYYPIYPTYAPTISYTAHLIEQTT